MQAVVPRTATQSLRAGVRLIPATLLRRLTHAVSVGGLLGCDWRLLYGRSDHRDCARAAPPRASHRGHRRGACGGDHRRGAILGAAARGGRSDRPSSLRDGSHSPLRRAAAQQAQLC